MNGPAQGDSSQAPLARRAGSPPLPRNFRKLPIEERRRVLREILAHEAQESGPTPTEGDSDELFAEALEWSDVMIESAVGYVAVPFGVATGFLIDGKKFNIPMAVEEPSVIAAATFAGAMIASGGGFHTWATEPEMVSQIFLEDVPRGAEQKVVQREQDIADRLAPLFVSMRARGGGYRSLAAERLDRLDIVRVDLLIDVRDAMGANIINTAAEQAKATIEQITGGHALMCILTNESLHRRAGAAFTLPVARLRRGRTAGEEAARRIALASDIAQVDPSRAVTHNKGVMNGISSLALATGNDTRSIEAAVHRWASRDGVYRGVTTFRVEDDSLFGQIEVPLPIATMGGSVGFHPSTRTALALLGNPDSRTLVRVAAALGLAQNFAALHALVTEGIQKGHMKLHSARLALLAGARGAEVRALADRIAAAGNYTTQAAKEMLKQLRSQEA